MANEASALRYCQSAIELPCEDLWGMPVLELDIARLRRMRMVGDRRRPRALAIGVVHDREGDGRPLLPVTVEFDLSEVEQPRFGWGEVQLTGEASGQRFYQAGLFVNDPGGDLYAAIEKAFGHAVLSRIPFFRLALRRDQHLGTGSTSLTAHKNRGKNGEQLHLLMEQVDAGEAELPPVEFNGASFDDILATDAPPWATSWQDSLGLLRQSFLDPATATWREERVVETVER